MCATQLSPLQLLLGAIFFPYHFISSLLFLLFHTVETVIPRCSCCHEEGAFCPFSSPSAQLWLYTGEWHSCCFMSWRVGLTSPKQTFLEMPHYLQKPPGPKYVFFMSLILIQISSLQYKLQLNLAFAGFEAVRENMCVIINICEFAHFEAHFKLNKCALWRSYKLNGNKSYSNIEVQGANNSKALSSESHKIFHKIFYIKYSIIKTFRKAYRPLCWE